MGLFAEVLQLLPKHHIGIAFNYQDGLVEDHFLNSIEYGLLESFLSFFDDRGVVERLLALACRNLLCAFKHNEVSGLDSKHLVHQLFYVRVVGG